MVTSKGPGSELLVKPPVGDHPTINGHHFLIRRRTRCEKCERPLYSPNETIYGFCASCSRRKG